LLEDLHAGTAQDSQIGDDTDKSQKKAEPSGSAEACGFRVLKI
jgi:hypothetical protein